MNWLTIYTILFAVFFPYVIPAQDYSIFETVHTNLVNGNIRYVVRKNSANQEIVNSKISKDQKNISPLATIIECFDCNEPIETIFDLEKEAVACIKTSTFPISDSDIAFIDSKLKDNHTPLIVFLSTEKKQINKRENGIYDSIQSDCFFDKNNSRNESTLWLSIESYIERSEFVINLLSHNKLVIIGAIYDKETGDINWLGKHPEQQKMIKHQMASCSYK